MLKLNFIGTSLLLLMFLLACDGIELRTPESEEIIDLSLQDRDGNPLTSAIIGDGESIIVLAVSLPDSTDEKFKTVTFSTSDGKFLDSGNKTTESRVDISGKTSVELQVPLMKGILFLTAQIGSDSDIYQDKESLMLEEADSVLKLSLLNLDDSKITSDLLADGVTTIQAKAKLLTATSVLNSVLFKTQNASFLSTDPTSNQVKFDANGEARIQLKLTNNRNPVQISARVGDSAFYEEKTLINTVPASPEMMYLEPTKLTMSLNDSNAINVFLRRNTGKVTQGHSVTVKHFQLMNNARVETGRISGLQTALSDAEGNLSFTFHTDSNDVDTNKVVFIEVISATDQDSIKKELGITIKP